jgi:predicted ATPase/class 3 adenylate cyclase
VAQSSRPIPTGTVTFLFSDIEGSTELVRRLDPAAYREVLEQHHRILRTAFAAHGGFERGTQGDSFLVVFRDAPSAIAAAVDAQRSLAAAAWPEDLQIRVRMGLHSGEGIPGGDDYVGLDINRAARIASAAHGGQVLVSEATRALIERSLPDGVSVRDIGEHRFKGLDLPERVHQVTIEGLAEEFPPLRSLSPRLAGATFRTTTFLGREREVAELISLLAANRLVTLVGPGGTGKTSLAAELAGRVADGFADGAVFVPLESIADPALVGSAIVTGLKLRDTSARTAREQLLDNLPGREILLILDNFEHVLEAASLVGELLATGPALKVVATSRAPLRLPGEQTFPVQPLPVPAVGDPIEPAALGSVDSVRLFVERARSVLPGFELTDDNAAAVVEICRLLDGLPLGIEIAVARLPLLGPAGIRDRLAQKANLPGSSVRGVPARQRTLRDAIAWSHDLLDEPGKRLFGQFSVFAGGCRLQELEAVCQEVAGPGADVVDSLATLVDQSLVVARQQPAGVRYEMLGTIRDVAAERLADDPDREAVARRHAHAYVALAEANAPRLETREQTRALGDIAADRDNLRAAVRWSIDHAVAEIGLRLAAALARYWWLAGEMDEGRRTVEAVLEAPGADAPTTWRMRGLEGAGLIYYYAGDNDRATAAYQAQLNLARQLEDRQGEADARFNLIFTRDFWTRGPDGLEEIDEIADSYRALANERSLARTMLARANLMMGAGRAADAQQVLEEAVDRYRVLGDLMYESQAANSLAVGGLMYGDRQSAARWFPASLVLDRAIGDTPAVAIGLPVYAVAALEFVGPAACATLLGAYDEMSRRYGLQMPTGLAQVIARFAPRERARSALDPADYEAAIEAGRKMSVGEVSAYLDETIGQIRVDGGDTPASSGRGRRP